MENNDNRVDSTVIKLVTGDNREDLVEGFTEEKTGDIYKREIQGY